jgi:hypothetical protein
MSCRPGDFARAIEHAKRSIAKYQRLSPETPAYRGQLRSEQIALEAMLLIMQHAMEGVVLSRVDQLRAERPCGGTGIPGEHCIRCGRRCGVIYG